MCYVYAIIYADMYRWVSARLPEHKHDLGQITDKFLEALGVRVLKKQKLLTIYIGFFYECIAA